jgi:cytochrome c556
MLRILIGGGLLFAVVAGAIAADDKHPSIDEIMKKVNNAKTGLHKKVGEGLKSAAPNWDEMQKQMKDYTKLCSSLCKNDPPKGDKASWEKLCKAYAEEAKKLQEAVDKKDKDAANKAHKALSKSCKACHDAHRE